MNKITNQIIKLRHKVITNIYVFRKIKIILFKFKTPYKKKTTTKKLTHNILRKNKIQIYLHIIYIN
jgi:hypothetical protein